MHLSLTLLPLLLRSDVGSLWSQGLGTSVSIGCGRECTRRLVFVGSRCGAIMVPRIRSNFCQYTMLWKRLEKKGARGKGIAWKGRRDVDENVLVDLYLFGSDVGPLWFRGLEGTSVSIGCFGRDWNRREPERKALLEELLLV